MLLHGLSAFPGNFDFLLHARSSQRAKFRNSFMEMEMYHSVSGIREGARDMKTMYGRVCATIVKNREIILFKRSILTCTK